MARWHTREVFRQGRHPDSFIYVIAEQPAEFLQLWTDLAEDDRIPKKQKFLRSLPRGEAALGRGKSAVIRIAEQHRELLERDYGSYEIPMGYFEILKVRLKRGFIQRGGPLSEELEAELLDDERTYWRELILGKRRKGGAGRETPDVIVDPYSFVRERFDPDDQSREAIFARARADAIQQFNERIRSMDMKHFSGISLSYDQLSKYEKLYERNSSSKPDLEVEFVDPSWPDWIQDYRRLTPEAREKALAEMPKFRQMMLRDKKLV